MNLPERADRFKLLTVKRLAARLRADSHTWAIACAVAVAAAMTAVCTTSLRLADPDAVLGQALWGMPWDALAGAPGAPAAATMAGLDQTLLWLGVLAVSICFLSLLLHAVGWTISSWNALAIRSALGAHSLHLWWLVCRRFLRGGLVGMVLGVTGGTAITFWLARARPDLVSTPVQFWLGAALATATSIGFLAVLALLAVPPAFVLPRRATLTPALQGDHATSGRPMLMVQGLLPILQFAGLLVVTFAGYVVWRELPAEAPSFDADIESVATVRIPTDTSIAQRAAVWRDLLAAMSREGDTVTLTSQNAWLGLGPIVPVMGFCDACRRGQFFTPVTSERVRLIALSPESLSVMAGQVVRGRDFNDADGVGAPPVVLLNQAAALRLFPGADSLGRTLRVGGANGVEHTVAGVVGLPRPFGPGNTDPVVPTVFVSAFQHPPLSVDIAFAGDANAADTLAGLRATSSLDIDEQRAVADQLRAFGAPLRFASALFTGVGAIATLIAVFGLVAVMFQLVETRRREMAIRLALGAQRRHIMGWVGRRAVRLTLVGVVLGMSGARLLWDVVLVDRSAEGAFGPVAVMAFVFAAIALLASVLPGMRASTLQPAVLARAIPSTTARDR